MERVVQTPYSALNDPHTEEFIKRPETRRLLYSQGLINENDEVMYTLGEFNKYRSYLRTLYSDDVHKCLHVAVRMFFEKYVHMYYCMQTKYGSVFNEN